MGNIVTASEIRRGNFRRFRCEPGVLYYSGLVVQPLFEEMLFEDGHLTNGTLMDYRIPTTADLSDEFRSIIVENADGPGPYGAKGVGEGAQAAIPAAIGCALADLGVEMRELPLTPERVWRHLRALGWPGGRERAMRQESNAGRASEMVSNCVWGTAMGGAGASRCRFRTLSSGQNEQIKTALPRRGREQPHRGPLRAGGPLKSVIRAAGCEVRSRRWPGALPAAA